MERTKKQRKIDELIAYHEAGHAVIARVLGVGIKYVSLIPFGGTPGAQAVSASYLARDADPETRAQACELDARVSLAGPNADKMLSEKRRKPLMREHEEGWEKDRCDAINAVASAVALRMKGNLAAGEGLTLTAEEISAVHERLTELNKQVEALVRDHWSTIVRTAEALLQRRILWDHELDALIKGQEPSVMK